MDPKLVNRLVAEPDTPEEFERRGIHLKKVISELRTQEAMYRACLNTGEQRTPSDAAAILNYVRAHLVRAAALKRKTRDGS